MSFQFYEQLVVRCAMDISNSLNRANFEIHLGDFVFDPRTSLAYIRHIYRLVHNRYQHRRRSWARPLLSM
jgi:hypothetical protein